MYKLVTYKPNSACSAPSRYLGSECSIVQVDANLGLTTVIVYDYVMDQHVELVVDSECVEHLKYEEV